MENVYCALSVQKQVISSFVERIYSSDYSTCRIVLVEEFQFDRRETIIGNIPASELTTEAGNKFVIEMVQLMHPKVTLTYNTIF